MAASACTCAHSADSPDLVFRGRCDASAIVELSPGRILVADDEKKKSPLAIYGLNGGEPTAEVSLATMGVDEELDLEGLAVIEGALWAIGSHGTHTDPAKQAARRHLFALDMASVQAGQPKKLADRIDLLAMLTALPEMGDIFGKASLLKPEEPGGLNIEGLAPAADGLYIGFRNPVPEQRAVIVHAAGLDEPGWRLSVLRLDLGGRGVRDIVKRAHDWLILAGAFDNSGNFALYQWDGATTATQLNVDFGTLRPEGIATLSDGRLLVVSDDGGVSVGGVECKDLKKDQQSFRGRILSGL